MRQKQWRAPSTRHNSATEPRQSGFTAGGANCHAKHARPSAGLLQIRIIEVLQHAGPNVPAAPRYHKAHAPRSWHIPSLPTITTSPAQKINLPWPDYNSFRAAAKYTCTVKARPPGLPESSKCTAHRLPGLWSVCKNQALSRQWCVPKLCWKQDNDPTVPATLIRHPVQYSSGPTTMPIKLQAHATTSAASTPKLL